ncbi:MAG: hypothetical protein ABIH03_10110 [Pseudomonadota bacterium]
MALVNVQEKWSSINGEIARVDAVWNFLSYRWAAARAYTVLYDAAATPIEAVSAVGIPAIGAAYTGGSYLTCIRKRALPLGPFLFEVIAEYAGKDSPLNDPYERSGETIHSVEETDVDANGDLLVNSEGTRVRGLQRDVVSHAYVITRNEAAEPESTVQTYSNKINSDVWKIIWDVGQARMSDIRYNRIVEGGSTYWRVTYRIECRGAGWNYYYLDEGPRFIDSAGEHKDVHWKTATGMARLKADGTLALPVDADHFITAPKYLSVAFAGLGLD